MLFTNTVLLILTSVHEGFVVIWQDVTIIPSVNIVAMISATYSSILVEFSKFLLIVVLSTLLLLIVVRASGSLLA